MALRPFASPRHCRGFSLLDVGLALSIAMAMTVTSFATVSALAPREKATATAQTLQQTVTGLRALYSSAEGAQVSADVLVKANQIPSRAIKDGVWVSSWDTPISVASSPTGWVVSYQGLSPSACQALVAEAFKQLTALEQVSVEKQPIDFLNEGSVEKACGAGERLAVAFSVPRKNSEMQQRFDDPALKRWGTADAL